MRLKEEKETLKLDFKLNVRENNLIIHNRRSLTTYPNIVFNPPTRKSSSNFLIFLMMYSHFLLIKSLVVLSIESDLWKTFFVNVFVRSTSSKENEENLSIKVNKE